MKRLLVVLALLVLCVGTVSADLNLNFQNSGDFINYVGCAYTGVGGSCAWVQTPNGLNSYVSTSAGGATRGAWVRNGVSTSTTYSAITLVSSSGTSHKYIYAYASDGTTVTYSFDLGTAPATGRYEIKMVGNIAQIYRDNKLIGASGGLASNPSYVGYGAYGGSGGANWDDFVYGDGSTHYVFGMPEEGQYRLVKDLLVPATSGFYTTSGTLISSFNFTSTSSWGDSNSSRAIVLREWGSGYEVGRYNTTVNKMNSTHAWSVSDVIFNNPDAPYGYYITTYAEAGSSHIEVSDVLLYSTGGATCAWGVDTYSTGDTATVNTVVSGGGYWDTVTYDYEVRITDAYNNLIKTIPVTTSTQTSTYTFTSSDSQGVYIAYLYAIKKSDSTEYLMDGDLTELTGYVRVDGWVNDAETELPISGAVVNITQGTALYSRDVTIADGNFSSSGVDFLTGAKITINATCPGYDNVLLQFTPAYAKTINVTVSMRPTTVSCTGLCIDGIDRDNVYHNPVSYATVYFVNTTYGESYSVTTGRYGYYLADESDGIFFTNGRLYQVHAEKIGYGNSNTEPVVARGL